MEHFTGTGDISDPGLSRSLLAKLDAAEAARDGGDTRSANGHVRAFMNAVKAQRGKHISTEAADLLLTDAAAVLDVWRASG